MDYWLRRTKEVLKRVEGRSGFTSHRHHICITDIAETAINVITIVVEGSGDDSLPGTE